MTRWVAALLLLGVAAGLYFLLRAPQPQSVSPSVVIPPPVQASNAVQPVHAAKSAANLQPPLAPAETPESLPPAALSSEAVARATPAGKPSPVTDPSDLPPATALDTMRTTIRQYAAAFGGNPVGTNLEITRALDGENPRGIKFLKLEGGLRTNELGELIDSWGTPYFFHQLSAREMEIRSAGPDKTLWTADDLASR